MICVRRHDIDDGKKCDGVTIRPCFGTLNTPKAKKSVVNFCYCRMWMVRSQASTACGHVVTGSAVRRKP